MNPTKPHDLCTSSYISKSQTRSRWSEILSSPQSWYPNRTPDFPGPIIVEGRGEEDIKCLCLVYMAIFEVTNLIKPCPNAISDSPFAMNIFVKVPFIVLPSAGLLELQSNFCCTNFLSTSRTESPPVSPVLPYTPLSCLSSRRRSLLSQAALLPCFA